LGIGGVVEVYQYVPLHEPTEGLVVDCVEEFEGADPPLELVDVEASEPFDGTHVVADCRRAGHGPLGGDSLQGRVDDGFLLRGEVEGHGVGCGHELGVPGLGDLEPEGVVKKGAVVEGIEVSREPVGERAAQVEDDGLGPCLL
jgi:hypothetical protein